MKTILNAAWCILILFFAVTTTASALEEKKPEVVSRGTETKTATSEMLLMLKVPAYSALFARVPIAMVNDDVIRMDELTQALASSHENRLDGAEHAGKIDYTGILDRLINIRLIAQEAVNIGIDDLPECKSALETNARKTSSAMVMQDIVKDVKADPNDVEKRFKEIAVEYKIKSVLFEKWNDAKSMYDAIMAGKSFEELAKKAFDDKTAKGTEEGEYLKIKDMLPQIASFVSTMQTGTITPIIKVQAGKNPGFTILKLEDKRYPENPRLRQQAEQMALTDKKNEFLAEFRKTLLKKQVNIKEWRLGRLDYDSPNTDYKKMLTDTRVVAEFKDGKTITVGDLTAGLEDKFYHGLEQGAKDKMLNKAKNEVLAKLIDEQLISNEAYSRGIEKSDAYQDSVKEFKLTTLFGLFINKMVVPDLKVTDDEVKAYYQEHKKEYTEPEMLKMVSLDFGNKRDAEAALVKLKKGADINWVRANAEGLVVLSDDEGGPAGGMLILTTKDLPAEMGSAVAGAKAGDFRLFAGSEDRFSVFAIQDVIPARQKPYEEVRSQIGQKVVDANLKKLMEDWFRKLRDVADIKVYLSGMGK